MRRFSVLIPVMLLLSSFGCSQLQESQPPADPAQEIVDKAIAAHGGDRFERARIEFDFRDRHYVVERRGQSFIYERHTPNEERLIVDRLDNKGFTRSMGGTPVSVPDSMVPRYSASVNSVAYFAVLPYRLNDAAVKKRYLGTFDINGTSYHKVEVTFRQEGGGEDHQDVFVYWFHPHTYFLDYLAYSYEETDGIGLRFRQAVNPQTIEGIRLQDYVNYKGPENAAVASLDSLFVAGKLEELSRILNENIEIRLLEAE